MTPTVGRIVHYYGLDDRGQTVGPWPAIVTAVSNDGVNLTVFPDGTSIPCNRLRVREGVGDSYWAWPPRDR